MWVWLSCSPHWLTVNNLHEGEGTGEKAQYIQGGWEGSGAAGLGWAT